MNASQRKTRSNSLATRGKQIKSIKSISHPPAEHMSLPVKYAPHLILCLTISILKMRIILFIHIPHSLRCYSTFLGILTPRFPGGSLEKNPPATSGDLGSNPDLGRSPGGGHGNPLHCFCPMDRGAQRAIYSPRGHKSDLVTGFHLPFLLYPFLSPL